MAALLFAGFWVVVALVIFFVAINGGARGARAQLQSQSRPGRRGAAVAFALVFLGFGIAVPAALLIGNNENASNQVRGVRLASSDRQGRTVFAQQCGVCHSLRAARTTGRQGPNLDILKPNKALVLDAVTHGRQRGNGTMPARLVTGREAQEVASFVGKVAGR